MKNYKSEGITLSLIAPYDVVSGAGFLVGSIFAVATSAALNGKPVEGLRRGEVTLPKAAGALAQGAKIYWDDAAKNVTATVGANKLIGAVSIAALAGDATAQLILIPTAA